MPDYSFLLLLFRPHVLSAEKGGEGVYGEKKRGKKRFMADSVHLVERHRSIWKQGGKEWRVTMAGFSLLFRLLAGIRPWMYGTGGKEGGKSM